jgi:multicomponent Na+:H+ antiporter subunit G
MTPRELAVIALLAGGVFFVFVGAVGLIRLPDIYTRSHATSKSDTLGVVLSLGGVMLAFDSATLVVKAFALIVFMFVTNPTASHAIARAAYDQGYEPWSVGDDADEEEESA